MKEYNIKDICRMFEKGIQNDHDREVLGLSLFYYCCGKDPTPIVAFGHEYPLYIYSDIVDYGSGDFDEETRQLYDRLEKAEFELLSKRELRSNVKAELTMWNSPQGKSLFLLYIKNDAVKTFEMIYSDRANYIQPRCICNYRYEMTDRALLETVEKKTEYIMGHCFSEKFRSIAEYEYFGDYDETAKITLYRRMF